MQRRQISCRYAENDGSQIKDTDALKTGRTKKWANIYNAKTVSGKNQISPYVILVYVFDSMHKLGQFYLTITDKRFSTDS